MGMQKGSTISKYIDKSVLPIYKNKYQAETVNWEQCVGVSVPFMYNNKNGYAVILENIDVDYIMIKIYYNNKIKIGKIGKCSFLNASFGNILKDKIIESDSILKELIVNIEDMYKYYPNSNIKVLMRCPICGYEDYYNLNHVSNRGFSCRKCSDGISYPEKMMRNILDQLNIEYITAFSPDWANRRFYDFYIPSHSLIIEMDGAIGHGNKSFDKTPEETLQIDKEKDLMAMQHGLTVIRIDCKYKNLEDRYEYIKSNIIHSQLFNLLNVDMNLIDFNKCNEYSLSSIIYDVCMDWDGTIASYDYICEKHHISRDTLKNYLKIGTEIGWCNYDASLAYQQRADQYASKPIKVLKNEKILGVFKSAKELERQSLELFGVQISCTHASEVCRGDRITHMGFNFAYITQEEYEHYYNLFGNSNITKDYSQENNILHIPCGKPVMVREGNNILGVFVSSSDLARKSFELFGKKMSRPNITKVCNGQGKTVAGFNVKYISLDEYDYYYKLFGNNNTKLL